MTPTAKRDADGIEEDAHIIIRQDFFQGIKNFPDIYGPFWARELPFNV